LSAPSSELGLINPASLCISGREKKLRLDWIDPVPAEVDHVVAGGDNPDPDPDNDREPKASEIAFDRVRALLDVCPTPFRKIERDDEAADDILV
jgi:hypothetical protein